MRLSSRTFLGEIRLSLTALRIFERTRSSCTDERRALLRYDTILGLMFLNQGLGLSCMGAIELPGIRLPSGLATMLIGVVFVAIGITVKVWATKLVGVDVYYYHDLFLDKPVGTFVRSGPYRFLANPMYGVGQLHAYGYALLERSAAGLAAAMVCLSLIYVFYFSVERPFVRRNFGGQVIPLVIKPVPLGAAQAPDEAG
jgi:protein-S-isoprenylcysteine O-methyltransferase Ste14